MALVKYNNNSISAVTALDSMASGDLNLLATNTITSGVASSNFTSNISSTYNTYIFKFINIHPATNNVYLDFQGSTDGGSNYNTTITSNFFRAYQSEDNSGATLLYIGGADQAQGTSYQNLSRGIGNGNDECVSGYLHLFSPSSNTFVKHFFSVTQINDSAYSQNTYVGGYFNTTSDIDAVSFKFSSGNIDSGVIKMYGLRES